jgi:hypothetical protein
LLAAPAGVFAVVRPLVSTDALALAIAAAGPIAYSVGLAVIRRRVDALAVVSAIGFAIACVVSASTGAGSLPLKLHEASLTFAIGIVQLLAVLVGRPLPIAWLLRVPDSGARDDRSLGAAIGGFLVLHALLHFVLAVELSTSAYLVAGRAIDWATIALGVLGLSAYRRRLRGLRQ